MLAPEPQLENNSLIKYPEKIIAQIKLLNGIFGDERFHLTTLLEMFYLNSTLNFGIPPVLVFQLEVYYMVDRLLTGLTIDAIFL